jgi:hypothetical protein
MVAAPRDIAGLMASERDDVAEIARLKEAVQPKVSKLDELAARRKRRIEEAQAV